MREQLNIGLEYTYREQALHAGGKPTIDGGPGDQRIMRLNRCPAVEQKTCGKRTGDDVVERTAPAIRDVAWN